MSRLFQDTTKALNASPTFTGTPTLAQSAAMKLFDSYPSAAPFASTSTNGAYGTSLVFDAAGNIYWAVSNYYNGTTYNLTSYVYKITPAGTLTTFASVATNGADGTSLVFDAAGNIYWAVSNYYNGTTYNLTSYVYKITPAGTLTTFASVATNGADGTSLVFDTSGNLYWAVANYYNGSTTNITSYVYKITPNGTLTTFASVATNGAVGTSLVFDTSGNLYWAVSNQYNGTTYNLTSYVYKITPNGTLTTFASAATNAGSGTSFVFDTSGNLYWAISNRTNGTTYNLTSYVYKITPTGTLTTFASVATIAGSGTSFVFDTSGNLYWSITNFYNGTTYNLTSYVYKITPNGTMTTFASAATNAGSGTSFVFDTSGNLYWAVSNEYDGTTYNLTSAIRKYNTSVKLDTLGTSIQSTGQVVSAIKQEYKTYTPAITSQTIATNGGYFNSQIFDNAGNLYVSFSNFYNGTNTALTTYVYKITPAGTITTFASATTYECLATALAFDTSGNLYWAVMNEINTGFSTYATAVSYVYKITPAGTMTTFASATTPGGFGTSLVFDTSGNLYWAVANYNNGTTRNLTSYVYKITPAGTLTTFASASTNGSISTSLVFDAAGNLYWAVTNYYNGTIYNLTSYVYKITPAGTMTTFASAATNGVYGTSLIFDTSGNLYWAIHHSYNGTTYNLTSYVYKITSTGTLTTFASQATIGAGSTSLVFDTSGNLYWAITNEYNGTTYSQTSYVYKITSTGILTTFASQATIGALGTSLVFDASGNLYWTVSNYYNGTTYNLNSYLYQFNLEQLS